MIWYAVLWYGIAWHGKYAVVWYCLVLHGMVLYCGVMYYALHRFPWHFKPLLQSPATVQAPPAWTSVTTNRTGERGKRLKRHNK